MLRPQFAQGENLDRLAVAADVADDACRRMGRLMAQDDVTGFFKVIGPLRAGRVIEAYGEIPGRSAVEAVFNLIPRRQKIAQGNEAGVGNERRPQKSGSGTCLLYTSLIAAPKSGSGKTTVVCALLQALKKRGLSLTAFKSGPD